MVRVWLRMVSLVGVVVTKVMRAAVGVRRFQVKLPSVLGVILALPVMVVRVVPSWIWGVRVVPVIPVVVPET